MTPEHAAELAKRGIVYTRWPSFRDFLEPDHPCVAGCGNRVQHPKAKCGRCRLASLLAKRDRKQERRKPKKGEYDRERYVAKQEERKAAARDRYWQRKRDATGAAPTPPEKQQFPQ